jgi:proteasome lid subunit RPN8/RPN11
MKIRFKIRSALLATIRIDLRRPHPFAHERVGFIAAGLAAAHDELLILAREYRPVRDDEYINDPRVGAMMSAEAIRRARQWAMDERVAIFHVHTHGGAGIPGFSGVDIRENAKFVPNFVSVAPHAVHGAIVLSGTAAFGQVWLDRKSPQPFITTFSEIGTPIRSWRAA